MRFMFAATFLLVLLMPSCRCARETQGNGGKKVFYSRAEGVGKSLDPQEQYDSYSAATVGLLYDSLYQYHHLKRPYELVPNVAISMPEYSEDGKVMTIRLRDDVYFNDDKCFADGKGRKVIASDVVHVMKRLGDLNLNTEGSVTLVEGMIEGYDDYIKKTKAAGEGNKSYYQDDISGIQALDEHTVQFKLTKATPIVFYLLGIQLTAIVAKECVDYYGEDFRTHPVGSGAFKVSYRNRKGNLILKKNPRYHQKYPSEGAPGDAEKGLLADAGKQLPLVDEVVIPVIMEPQPAMLKFMRGQLDWVRIDSDSFSDLAVKNPDSSFSIRPPHDKKYEIFPAVDLSAYWWIFNMKDPVLGKNPKLRKAIAHALDRQGYVRDIYNGRGDVVDSMVPSSIVGNAKDLGVSWYPYDIAKAKALLAEAGYPGGQGLPPITYFYAAGPTLQRQYEYMRRNLAEIGVKLVLDSAPYAGYITKFQTGNFQFSMGGWNADYLDPENFLMLFTKTALDNGLYYGGAWYNDEYDTLLAQVRAQPSGTERNAFVKKMMEIIKEDVPYIPIFTYNRVGLKAPWLRNWKRDMASDKEAIYVDIDLELKAKGYEP